MADVRTGSDTTVIAVPAPLSTTGGGTEATALRVTVATDSTGVLSVDDNGATLSVDWNGTQPVTGSGTATGALRVELPTNGTGTVGLNTGSNAIGKLAANSGIDIGDVDVTSLPALAAGTNLIGRTSSSDETSTVYNGTTALTPKFAMIDVASNGDNTILAAVTSKKIRVHQLLLVSAGITTVRFESGASGTALTGQMTLAANSGFTLPYSPLGWFETGSGVLLNLELSAAISVDGCFTYTEV